MLKDNKKAAAISRLNRAQGQIKAYGGMGMDQARRLKELETENARLKRVVADLSLDNQILKDVASGNF